jgi:hypothetical protein
MRTCWKWAVVLAVPAIVVGVAWSQEPGLPEGTTVKLLLLRQKSVQKELELSADVVMKIMAFTNEEAEAALKAIELPAGPRKTAFDQLEEKNKKFLADTLNAKQNNRIEQLYLQFTATHHLTKPEAAKLLELTEEQQKKFKDLHDDHRKALADILFGKDIQGKAEKYAKLHEQTRTRILAILTDKQQAKARELAGPPFMGEIVFEEIEITKKK